MRSNPASQAGGEARAPVATVHDASDTDTQKTANHLGFFVDRPTAREGSRMAQEQGSNDCAAPSPRAPIIPEGS
jgi:hypothetical protein